jgi:hypothetical protein
MKKTVIAIFATAALGAGCTTMDSGWTTLVDGTRGLENFVRVGDANWSAADGAIQATASPSNTAGFLVTKGSYKDLMIRAEVWVSDDANSGIFFRCQEPGRITDENCYEANLFDTRPDPTYGTGAIVKVAKVAQPSPRAGGRWNSYEITAKGTRLTLVLNGQKTVDVDDAKLASGPIALQWARGVVKFRKVEVKPL